MPSVSQRIAQQYPFLAFLANDPQVGPLLRRAVDLNQPYSPERFTAELMKTRWWKKLSDSARQWQIIANTRPGEALQQRQIMNADILNLASQLGIKLTQRELLTIREAALRSGQTAGSVGVRNYLIALTRKGGRTTGAGMWATTATNLRSTAQDYLTSLPDHVARKWAEWIVGGEKTMDDFKASSQMEAMKRFPHMAAQLKQGLTPKDVISPYVELWAQQQGVQPSQVYSQLNNSWEHQILGVRDPKTKQMRLPTESEVIKMVRQTPLFWKGAIGKEVDAQMASSLLNTFGKRKTA